MTTLHATDLSAELENRLRSRAATVAVLGLGYVGLPLAVAFAHAGFSVRAIDVDARKIDSLRAGTSYIGDVPDASIAEVLGPDRLVPSDDYASLAGSDAIVISVPTPM